MDNYIDSRGAEMAPMSFSEALEIVHELASQNQIDTNDIAFADAALEAQRLWQKQALDTLHDFVVNHGDALDELTASERAQDWPEEVTRADRSIDPTQVANAIKICLAMAEQNALTPETVEYVEQAEQCDRQQQALDVTRDLLGMHGAELERVANIDISPLV